MDPEGRNIDHVVISVHDLDQAAATYEGLGFTLTPRAQHPWGTANRLVQMPGGNFIELLEIERPELIFPHDLAASPPRFSFGAYNRDVLETSEGMSMLVLVTSDSRADIARFEAAGLQTYAPFDFERAATLPDGTKVKVAFSVAFATHPDMSRAVFFTCHNRFPENFWKPEFQSHENGAQAITETVMVADEPERYRDFLLGFTGGRALAATDGLAVSCGTHVLSMLTPGGFTDRFGTDGPDLDEGPRFAAIVVEGPDLEPGLTPAAEACGVAIAWRRSS